VEPVTRPVFVDVTQIGVTLPFVETPHAFFREPQSVGDFDRYEMPRCVAHRNRHAKLSELEFRAIVSARQVQKRGIAARTHVVQNVADQMHEVRGGHPAAAVQRGEALVIGTATDPYQPAERRFRLTRGVLEVLAEHPGLRIVVITKSPLITRDVDVLARIARHSTLSIHLSLITLDRDLARRLEPRAPTPEARLRALARLRGVGLDVGINVMPVLPGITDGPAGLDALVARVAAPGATHVNTGTLRLQAEARKRYLPFVEQEFPHLAARYRAAYARDSDVSAHYRDGLQRFLSRVCKAHRIPLGSPDRDRARRAPQVEHDGQLALAFR